MFHAVCEEAIDALNIPAASVMLYDEKSDEFRVAAALGMPSDHVPQNKGIPRALYDEYARTAVLVITNRGFLHVASKKVNSEIFDKFLAILPLEDVQIVSCDK